MVKLLCNLAKESDLTYLPKVYKTYTVDSIPNMSQYPAGKRGKAGYWLIFGTLSREYISYFHIFTVNK